MIKSVSVGVDLVGVEEASVTSMTLTVQSTPEVYVNVLNHECLAHHRDHRSREDDHLARHGICTVRNWR